MSKKHKKRGKPVIFGNAGKRSLLESVNIHAASTVIIALDNMERLHLVCDIISKMAPRAKIVVKVDRFKEKDALQEEFPHYEIVVGTEQVARGMVEASMFCRI